MPRVLLIADDESHWPAALRPPVEFVPANQVLRLHLSTFAEHRSLLHKLRPEVIHADGPAAVRATYLLTKLSVLGFHAKQVVSGAADAEDWLTRRALRAADRVIARTQTEATQYAAMGIPPERITRIPYGVADAPTTPDPIAFRRSLDIPDSARLVIAAGAFDVDSGLKTAVWAFDVAKYAAPDLHLVLIGDGPERDRLSRFAKALGFDDFRVRFAGTRPDAAALLGLAEVVWVTHTHGGVELALAAMAAGRPVVAARTPDLAEVIEDGVMGRLVDATDRVRLAAITNELLETPEVAARLGAAARAHVQDRFPASEVGERFAEVYRDVS